MSKFDTSLSRRYFPWRQAGKAEGTPAGQMDMSTVITCLVALRLSPLHARIGETVVKTIYIKIDIDLE